MTDLVMYGQLLFVISALFAKNKVTLFALIPSLLYSTFEHLVIGKKVRKLMGWSGKGVSTLQNELGIMQLMLLVAAIWGAWKRERIVEATVGIVWGLSLIVMGIQHFLTSRGSAIPVGIIDISLGFIFILVYHQYL